jgi:hypothetical protein
MSIHLAILRSAAWLVPGEQRAEWLAEWNAELWYVRRSGERQTTSFCLGAFRDALWLRRNSPPNAKPWLRLQSPAHCLGFLGVVATGCVLLALRYQTPDCPLLPIGQSLLWMLLTALMALPALVAITSLRLGEYPANRCGWRWVFFAGKIALVIPIVFFGVSGVLAVWPIVGGVIGTGMPVLYVLAFRWVLIDQRQRCPECLRLLGYPTPIGQPSHTFLEWYGKEFVCVKGHGLLHVPETPTTSFPTQRWLHLDQSWSVWFS